MEEKKNLEVIGDYWTQRSEGFSEHMLENMEEDEKGLYIRRIRAFSNTRKMKVLDIGTGPGLFPIILGRDGNDVIAIDYSDGMLELAKKNCKDKGVPANIFKMDAQHLEFEDESFDLIVSRKVLWNLEDPVGAYKEWLRVLKPDGKMILFDANWWLHFHDEEYKKLHENFQEEMRAKQADMPEDGTPGSEYPHKYQGADPRILHEFAKELPLSHVRRPSWDVQILSELGAQSIIVDIDRSSPAPDDSGRILPDSFVLTISKTKD